MIFDNKTVVVIGIGLILQFFLKKKTVLEDDLQQSVAKYC